MLLRALPIEEPIAAPPPPPPRARSPPPHLQSAVPRDAPVTKSARSTHDNSTLEQHAAHGTCPAQNCQQASTETG
eukprot:1130357-Pleurochrysis_carterae.AAC.2